MNNTIPHIKSNVVQVKPGQVLKAGSMKSICYDNYTRYEVKTGDVRISPDMDSVFIPHGQYGTIFEVIKASVPISA
jgi:hypothetical protein